MYTTCMPSIISKNKRNTNCNVVSTYIVPVQALEAETFFSKEEEKGLDHLYFSTFCMPLSITLILYIN